MGDLNTYRAGADEGGHFGIFGGRYVAETLMPLILDVEKYYNKYKDDPEFCDELAYYLKHYVGRPSPLYYAQRITEHLGGAKIYMKRDELNHTGAHKINSTMGQILLAKRMGKPRIIAETGAGQHGGHVVVEGTIEDVIASKESMTGAYLSGRKSIPVPKKRRKGNGHSIVVHGARANNLKNISIALPLGTLTCITGVSGSGKSTLVNEILSRKLAQHFYRSKDRPGEHDEVTGLEYIDKVINIDQSAIGRTPRSNPATYTGVFTTIREIFASMPEAKARGYKAGRFSFNVKGGRCEACSGAGYVQIEMQFLPDVTVPCEVCLGERYNREALEIKFKGKSISEVLDMTVSEAAKLFENIPSIASRMRTLTDVGLGYIHLGQPATTLSGGEAQRIKLASELSKRSTGQTIYILDEPTTGLSFDDAAKLMLVLHRLVNLGNTVILIEHHLDMIKNADWLIDLGPLAGERGGELVAQGTPEYVASVKKSFTGQYLKNMNGIKPDSKAPGTTRPRKFKTAMNGKVIDDIALPDRPASSPNGATKSRRNTRRWRRRRRGAATAG